MKSSEPEDQAPRARITDTSLAFRAGGGRAVSTGLCAQPKPLKKKLDFYHNSQVFCQKLKKIKGTKGTPDAVPASSNISFGSVMSSRSHFHMAAQNQSSLGSPSRHTFPFPATLEQLAILANFCAGRCPKPKPDSRLAQLCAGLVS